VKSIFSSKIKISLLQLLFLLVFSSSAQGNEEAVLRNETNIDSLWHSTETLPVPMPSGIQLIPFRYTLSNTISTLAPDGDSLYRFNDKLLKLSYESDRLVLIFDTEYVLSLISSDSTFCYIELNDFYEIERIGGQPFSSSEILNYESSSVLHREQHLVFRDTEIYSVTRDAVVSHYDEADYQHSYEGYLAAKHHLISSYASDSLFSTSDSRMIESQRLSQDSRIDVDRWITMNLVGGATVWGERSDSLLSRNVTFTRTSAIESVAPDSIGQCISYENSDFGEVTQQWDHIFDQEISSQDTVSYNKNLYLYIHPDTYSANSELRRGLIFMVPIAGKLACSLYVNTTPSLEEFAWASLDAAIIGGTIWWRHVAANGVADDVAERVIEASTSTPTSSSVVERANTQTLRAVLESAGRPSGPGQIHHIVSVRDNAANVSRQILERYGIDLNYNAANLVPLVNHCGRHSSEYYRTVESMLRGASSKADVIEVLNTVAERLSSGAMTL